MHDEPEASQDAQEDVPVPSCDARSARLERRCYAKTLRAIQPIEELNSVSSLVSVRIAIAMMKSSHYPYSSRCVAFPRTRGMARRNR